MRHCRYALGTYRNVHAPRGAPGQPRHAQRRGCERTRRCRRSLAGSGLAGLADVSHQAVIRDKSHAMLSAAFAHAPGCDIAFLDELMDERTTETRVRADRAGLRYADPLRTIGAAIVCRQAGGVRCFVHADIDVHSCIDGKSIGFSKPDRLIEPLLLTCSLGSTREQQDQAIQDLPQVSLHILERLRPKRRH